MRASRLSLLADPFRPVGSCTDRMDQWGHCCVSAKRTRYVPLDEADPVGEQSGTTHYGQHNTPI